MMRRVAFVVNKRNAGDTASGHGDKMDNRQFLAVRLTCLKLKHVVKFEALLRTVHHILLLPHSPIVDFCVDVQK